MGVKKEQASKKPVVAVDFDDVLTEHHQGLIDWFNKRFGTHLSLDDVHGSDPLPWGVDTNEEAIRRVHQYFDSQEFKSEKPFSDAVDVLSRLTPKYQFIVVTGRDYMLEVVTREWLEAHFKDIFSSVHFTAQYNLHGASRSKADLVTSENITYLIDDNIGNIKEVVTVGAKGILFGNYPWNATARLPDGVVRCAGWNQVEEFLNDVNV